MVEKTELRIRITFTEPMLGTKPRKDIAEKYITSKAREKGIITAEQEADELGTLAEELEIGTTVFARDAQGRLEIQDYMLGGFFREWGGALNKQIPGLTNVRSKIANYLYIFPRHIPLTDPDAPTPEYLERSLRGMTQQGPRVGLARSEMIPAGTTCEFKVVLIGNVIKPELVLELLSMGAFKGLGQWRNGSYGRFTYEVLEG